MTSQAKLSTLEVRILALEEELREKGLQIDERLKKASGAWKSFLVFWQPFVETLKSMDQTKP